MNEHLKRSRVTKALTDTGLASSFAEAENRLDQVAVCVFLGADQAITRAGQSAAMTALATAYKSFGRVHLTIDNSETRSITNLKPLGGTIGKAALALGASVSQVIPSETTHLIQIGECSDWRGWHIRCWWDRWLSGIRDEKVAIGESTLGLSGIFAAALAVRQVFAHVRTGVRRVGLNYTISLWTPWLPTDASEIGPIQFTAPNAVWMVGLGHLGQAFVWNLLTIPYKSERRAILQDDQFIDVENEATSLLVFPCNGVGERKARLASKWLEAAGWKTELIERRNRGEFKPAPNDPPFLLSGLDSLPPRKLLARLGFDFMVDAGIGHGPGDFEGLQVRVIPKNQSIDNLWDDAATDISRDHLLSADAYQALERKIGACGAYTLANASIAVPFVGAATGAIAIAQLIRLASMQAGGSLIQLDLASPEMMIDGGIRPPSDSYLGGEIINLTEER